MDLFKESAGTRRLPAGLPPASVWLTLRRMDVAEASFDIRPAVIDDAASLTVLIERAVAILQQDFLAPAQIASSRAIMALDTQLIRDGTYFVAESATGLVGCGGWSGRATLFGGDQVAGRDDGRLDPAIDAARIRAMYTDPDHARRGIGRRILDACEAAAAAAGFRRVELAATLAGEPLYRAGGYRMLERFEAEGGIPLLRMGKALDWPSGNRGSLKASP